MAKLVEIKITKGLLVLPEHYLAQYLPPGVYMEALKRGKAVSRHRQQTARLENPNLDSPNKANVKSTPKG